MHALNETPSLALKNLKYSWEGMISSEPNSRGIRAKLCETSQEHDCVFERRRDSKPFVMETIKFELLLFLGRCELSLMELHESTIGDISELSPHPRTQILCPALHIITWPTF